MGQPHPTVYIPKALYEAGKRQGIDMSGFAPTARMPEFFPAVVLPNGQVKPNGTIKSRRRLRAEGWGGNS